MSRKKKKRSGRSASLTDFTTIFMRAFVSVSTYYLRFIV